MSFRHCGWLFCCGPLSRERRRHVKPGPQGASCLPRRRGSRATESSQIQVQSPSGLPAPHTFSSFGAGRAAFVRSRAVSLRIRPRRTAGCERGERGRARGQRDVEITRTCRRAPGRSRAPFCAKTRDLVLDSTAPARRDRHGRTTSDERSTDGDERHRVETGERQAGRRCCHGRSRLGHNFAEHCNGCDRRSNRGLRGDGRRGRVRGGGRHRNAGAH